MALILAIEPDERQAAQLTDVINRRVSAELVLADSTERALIAIGDRVPDLILIPMLLSPQEDAALAGALRVIAAAGRVQMLTIPVLAEAAKPPKKRGMLAQFRRSRAASAHPDGCDPSVFGDQIAAYLAEAALARQNAPADVTAIDAPIEDVLPAMASGLAAEAESVAAMATPAIEEMTGPADAPNVILIHEPIVAALDEQFVAPLYEQVLAPHQKHVVARLDERFAAAIDEPLVVPLVEPVVESVIIPLIDSAVLPMDPVVLAMDEPIAKTIDQPVTMAAEIALATTDQPAAVVIDQSMAIVREEPADFDDYDPIAIQIEQSLHLPIGQSIIVPREEPFTIAIDEDVAFEAEEPAVYELSLDEWSNDAASMMAISAMMLPVDQPSPAVAPVFEPPVSGPEAADVVEPIAADQIFVVLEPEVLGEAEPVAAVIDPPVRATVQSVAALSESTMLDAAEPVLVVSEPLAVAPEGTVAAAFEPPVVETMELVDVVSEPTLLAAVAPVEPVTEPLALTAGEPVVQVVDTPVLAAIEPVAPAIESKVLAAEPAAIVSKPTVKAAVEPVAVVNVPPQRASESPAVVAAAEPVAASAAAALDEDPGFFGGGAAELPEAPPATPPAVAAAPVKPKRHEWVELVESLRLDLERRRVERAAQEADATDAPVREPAAPSVATARVLTMEPKKGRRPATLVRTKTRKKPVQNEWGLFDPDQCGFAALLAKLDEITHAK